MRWRSVDRRRSWSLGQYLRTSGVVETGEFLSAFRHELTDFLQNRFDVQAWLYHENEEEQSAYRDELLKHPFLVGVD